MQNENAKHTALPWEIRNTPIGRDILSNKVLIAQCKHSNSEANAEFIVKAVNSHYKLIEALKKCVNELTQTVNYDEHCPETVKAVKLAGQTLKKAGQ